MSYVITDSQGLGTNAGAAGGAAGGEAGGDSGGSTGDIIGAVGGALATIIGGAIALANNIELWRQQRRDIAGRREEAWAAEIAAINQENLNRQMAREELEARSVVIAEQERFIAERERIIGLEGQAIEAQMERDRLRAEQAAREREAMRFRLPTWGWWALAGVGVASVVGVGAYMGVKEEEEGD